MQTEEWGISNRSAAEMMAEIERLQAEVVKWKREAGKYTASCEQCEPYRAALAHVKSVCEDNAAATCNQAMALDFVRQVAATALD